MSKYFPRELLYRLRNEIPLQRVVADHLNWPCKRREGRFCFVCPRCGESLTAVNPRTNLGRCFRCEENFNAIDFVMLATGRLRGGRSLPRRPAARHVLRTSCCPSPLIPRLQASSPRHEPHCPRLYVSQNLGLLVSNSSGLSSSLSQIHRGNAAACKSLQRLGQFLTQCAHEFLSRGQSRSCQIAGGTQGLLRRQARLHPS